MNRTDVLWNRPGLLITSLIAGLLAFTVPAEAGKGIFLALDLPAEQSEAITQDLKLLKQLQFEDHSKTRELGKLFEIRDSADGQVLNRWLHQRVTTILAESFNVENSLLEKKKPVTYPATALPPTEEIRPEFQWYRRCELLVQDESLWDRLNAPPVPTLKQNESIVMSNLGMVLYGLGKYSSRGFELLVPGKGLVEIKSPRVGLIQVGKGLFLNWKRSETPNYPQSLERLAVFLHEARHSDGNAQSLGFLHATCPLHHDLAGLPACDRATNGAYKLGAVALQQFTENLSGLPIETAAREALRLTYLDSFSREIKVQKWVTPCVNTDESRQLSQHLMRIEGWLVYNPRSFRRKDETLLACKLLTDNLNQQAEVYKNCPSTELRSQELDAKPEKI